MAWKAPAVAEPATLRHVPGLPALTHTHTPLPFLSLRRSPRRKVPEVGGAGWAPSSASRPDLALACRAGALRVSVSPRTPADDPYPTTPWVPPSPRTPTPLLLCPRTPGQPLSAGPVALPLTPHRTDSPTTP